MAVVIPKVNAGDLVKHRDWNLMVDAILELQLKVSALEASTGGSGVNITSVTASTSPIRVGTRITVHGSGFVMPAALNNVTVGGVTVPPAGFTFSSDATHLIFDVPDQTAEPAATGTIVTLSVVNANGSDSTTLLLFAEESVPTGNIEVFYTSAPVMPATPVAETNIQADRSYVFTYTVRTSVDLPATYAVVPNLTGQAGWTAVLLEDTGDQPRSSSNINIAGGDDVDTVARVRVTIPAGVTGTPAATLVLNVTAAAAGTGILPGISSPITITLGSPPPTPETRARITLRSAVTAGRVQLTRNVAAGVNFNLVATANGTYTMSAAFRNAGAGTVDTINPVVIGGASPAAPVTSPFFAVVRPGGTTGETELIVTVRGGSPLNLQVEYWLPVRIV